LDTESKAVGFAPLLKAYGFGLHFYPLKIYRWKSLIYVLAQYQYFKIWVQQLNSPHPRPSPKGRGETRYALSHWERAGVRGLNLDILSIVREKDCIITWSELKAKNLKVIRPSLIQPW
jgi:hypothetical protein